MTNTRPFSASNMIYMVGARRLSGMLLSTLAYMFPYSGAFIRHKNPLEGKALALSGAEIARVFERLSSSSADLSGLTSYSSAVRGRLSSGESTSAVYSTNQVEYDLPSLDIDFIRDWNGEFARAYGFSRLAENWDGEGSGPVDLKTVEEAIRLLSDFSGRVPAPSFSPGSDGDLWALWAGYGLDIEICFRRPNSIFAMIADKRGEISEFEDDDPGLAAVGRALWVFSRRVRDAEFHNNLAMVDVGAPGSTSSLDMAPAAA